MTIYDFIRKQEVSYQKPIQLEDGWDWCMKDHLRRSFLYKNSQFEENNEDRELRPNKNIILAIRNLQNRTEGFDVKDIDLYVDDSDNYHLSLLVKKFHEKWALKNAIDTRIDESVDSYGDYGGVLAKNVNEVKPEIVDLRTLAFCNQRDILAYPFCIKHIYSPSQLREMDKWGLDENGATCSIEDLLLLSKEEDDDIEEIEVYELHGNLPIDWLSDKRDSEESKKDTPQIQIVAYYKKQDNNEQGVTLFRKREPELPFKVLKRDDIKDRALGRGGIEELTEPQKWTNWNEIKITEMLNAASKMIPWTNDSTLAAKHPTGMKGMDNMEFLELTEGKTVGMIDTYPRNIAVFNDAVERYEAHARQLGAASEGLLSGETKAAMPFKLFEAKTIEDKSMHRFRQGQIAVFWDDIYRDWVLSSFEKEIANDQSFLAELSADEMNKVAKNIATKQWNKLWRDKILDKGQVIEENKDEYIQKKTDEFLRTGNKQFIKILKGELKDISIAVHTNIASKQKDLALLTDKLVNVLRQFIATPQIRQDPEMVKLLNVILESSGMSPIMFGSSPLMQPQMQPQQGGSQPLQQLGQMATQNAQ